MTRCRILTLSTLSMENKNKISDASSESFRKEWFLKKRADGGELVFFKGKERSRPR